MKDIKTKDKSRYIKLINKPFILSQKVRSSIATLNKKADSSVSQNDSNEEHIEPVKKIVASTFKLNYKITKRTYDSVREIIKQKRKAKKMQKVAIESAKRAKQAAEETSKTFYRTFKILKKSVPFFIKTIFNFFSLFISLGIISIIIIISVILTGIVLGSYQGVLFSSEDINDVPMKEVIRSVNNEMASKINEIKESNLFDEYKIVSNKADWKDVLSLYSVKVSNNNQNEVIILDDNKVNEIKNIFWNMNSLSYELKEENLSEDYDSDISELKKVLYIYINSESLEDMMSIYNFTEEQRKQVEDLLSGYYDDLWLSVIYGVPIENSDSIVNIALSQVGNVGGEIYWRWYGFDSRVEWCAIFVSWVLNQAGIDESIIPKFSVVSTGVNWFKAVGSWHESSYIPSPGDIIFFDWEVDGKVNHVGIVEKVENEVVYTIEGNSNGDMCRQKSYSLNSSVIYGYGVLTY